MTMEVNGNDIRTWLITWIADGSRLNPGSIDVHERFHRYGVDSVAGTRLVTELSEKLGRALAPTLLWQYPTIDALVGYLTAGEKPRSAFTADSGGNMVAHDEPIAIVGMACRFPGAANIEAFWKLLCEGRDAITEVPKDRWDSNAYYDDDGNAQGKMRTKWGGFLEHVDQFEPLFFGISPREAMQMDPQQRLMLELTWEALEDVGIVPAALKETDTAVYIGALFSEYMILQDRLGPNAVTNHTSTGGASCIISNRISYTLGLMGPSMTVETACSSALVAVQLACSSLRRGETRLALAGGVNLLLLPETSVAFDRLGAMSPNGRCQAFDASADGYVRSEGAGLVVLKRLRDALADGDRIHCILRGGAVNNDGPSNGLTAPNPAAQRVLLEQACRDAGVDPATVRYVEAHGTGTPLGDPIEASGLGAIYGSTRPDDDPLRIGSVKTNIGHLEAAAGIAGLIKAALVVEHGMIPPSLHFQTPNPLIDFETLHLRVVSALEPWPDNDQPRRAGISSFGYGGTGAHVIVESLPLLPRAHAAMPATSEARRGTAWIFSGQGSVWPGMGRELLLGEPAFRAAITRCDAVMRPEIGFSILDELYQGSSLTRLERIDVAWPLLFAFQVALAAFWRSRGLEPAVILGHSIGEVAAAFVAGALTLDDAAKVICHQAKLVQQTVGNGAMAFVAHDWSTTEKLIGPFGERLACAIAASPSGTVISGEASAIVEIVLSLQRAGTFARTVATTAAVHTRQMDEVERELPTRIAGIRPRETSIPFVSSKTGEYIDGKNLDVQYWSEQLRAPVLFRQAVDCILAKDGADLFLELSPHPIVQTSIEECIRNRGGAPNRVIGSLVRGESASLSLGAAMDELVQQGAKFVAENGADAEPRTYLVPLSAKTPEALVALAQSYHEWMASTDATVEDIAFTTSLRRSHLGHRACVIGSTKEEIAAALAAFAAGEKPLGVMTDTAGRIPPKVVFVFPGQGSQWIGMSRQLRLQEAVFRDALLAGDEAVRMEAGFSVIEELDKPAETSRLAEIDVVQPVLFAIEVALAALWRSWGVQPAAVIGHSMGEVAAAFVAGALSLQDAAAVICRRSRLLRQVSGQGAMALVELTLENAERALVGHEDRLSVAASNGPRSTVFAGDPAALEEVLGKLEREGVFCRRVKVDVASHSPQMDALRGDLLVGLAEIAPKTLVINMRSTVTGAAIRGEELLAAYWADNLRKPVLFSKVVQDLCAEGQTIFVEMSPNPILLTSIADNLRAENQMGLGAKGVALPSLRRAQDEKQTMLSSLAELHVRGVAVQWDVFFLYGGRVVSLPTYPWQREQHWLDVSNRPHSSAQRSEHPLLGMALSASTHADERIWQQSLSTSALPWLEEHRVRGEVVFPGAGYIECVLEAAVATFGTSSFVIEQMSFEQMLVVPEGQTRDMQVVLIDDGAHKSFQISSRMGDEPWTRHALGRIVSSSNELPSNVERPEVIRSRCSTHLDIAAFYQKMRNRQMFHGSPFQGIVELRASENEVWAKLELPEDVSDHGYVMHPALLDACVQACGALFLGAADADTFVPVGMERLEWIRRPGRQAWVMATKSAMDETTSDVCVMDEDGNVSIAIQELRWQRIDHVIPAEDPLADCLYDVQWREDKALAQPKFSGRGTWLVVADRNGLSDALLDRLSKVEASCIRLVLGSSYRNVAADVVEIDASNPEDYRRLFVEMFGESNHCQGVVHMSSLDVTPFERTTTESLVEDLAHASVSATYLAQAIVRHGFRDTPRFFLVTRGAQAVFPSDPVSVSQAPILGLGKAIAMEHPELSCKRIDLPFANSVGDVDGLLRELSSKDREDQVALRAELRYVARLVPDRFGSYEKNIGSIRPDCTYMITGGLGGLGLSLASWLVEQGARHLALVGRKGPSDEARAKIQSLEQTGAQVHCVQVDVSRDSDVEKLFGVFGSHMAPLGGIVHAAMVLEDHTLLEQTNASFQRVFAPKALGAWNLHKYSVAENLDFFVMYSSATGLVGSPGQGNYCASNAYLDALAHERARMGLPGMSIQWGPFAEIGQAAVQDSRGKRLMQRGMANLLPEEGLEALRRLLAAPRGQMSNPGVVKFDARQWVEFYPSTAGIPFFADVVKRDVTRKKIAVDANDTLERLRAARPEERLSLLDRYLAEQIGFMLQLESARIDRTMPFQSLGMDSLSSLELRNKLEASLGVRLSATVLFAHSGVAALAKYLLEQLAFVERPAEPVVVVDRALAPLGTQVKAIVDDIAVVGMACRFPGGSNDVEAFWRALENGVDGIRRISGERWPLDAIDQDKLAVRWAGLLDSVDTFDAAFFGITPREASKLDPQQRLLLEVSWEALENAGQAVRELLGSRTSVFLGMFNLDYQDRVLDVLPYDSYTGLGSLLSTAAGRISYTFGFEGPCATIDTACSSSLTAVHFACQSLRTGESDMALAGGVNLILSPAIMMMISELQALSPDGRCKTFDARANGFVRGEGCGMVVLKRLSDAQRSGDRILGVIRGSVMNQDGRSTGLTAPNVLSQQAMLRRALEISRLGPEDIGYVETHGTGTSLGDPIEFEALREVMGGPRRDGSTCVLGALKSNVGHMEGAAGIGGLIKAILCLEHEAIPKNLHFNTLNPRMSLEGTPFVIPTETIPWKSNGKPRRAGVSSFGISGTNAHVILEEAPRVEEKPFEPSSSYVVPLSAQNPDALVALAKSFQQWLFQHDEPLHHVAYTATSRRSHLEHRACVVGSTKEEIAAALGAFAAGEKPPGVVTGKAGRLPPKIVFVFPGQGSQWIGMSRQLRQEESVFRDALLASDEAIRKEAGFSVIDELDKPDETSRLSEIDVVQPVLFAIEVALAALWRSWGVEPAAVIGHSMGEVAAAFVAGALSLPAAAAIICRRSRLLRQVSGKGAMALVELTLVNAEKALVGYEDRLSVAASNGPRSTVIAGDPAALEEVLGKLERDGVFCRRVKVDVASHSPQMDSLRDELLAALKDVSGQPATIPMRSTVTATLVRGDELDAQYWVDNLRRPVLFSNVVEQWIAEGHTIFVEMSPHPLLPPSINEILRGANAEGMALASTRREQNERQTMLLSLGALHAHGSPIAWKMFYPDGGRVVALPTYPWQRERFWIDGEFSSRLPSAPILPEHIVKNTHGESRQGDDVRFRLALEGSSPTERLAKVEQHVRMQVSQVIQLEASRIESRKPFGELGLDSMMSLELRNRLESSLELPLSATLVYAHPTVQQLSAYLVSRLFQDEPPFAVRPVVSASTAALSAHDDIAIIGMALRAPGGANTPEAFMQLLLDGVDTVSAVPADRYPDRVLGDDPAMRGVRWGAFIKDDVGRFDAAFFGISPREAQLMDPQQRLLLETSWEALERAGQDPNALVGRSVGVFIGIVGTDYTDLGKQSRSDFENLYGFAGNMHSVAAGRLSYVFGFQGPSMVVETACSSSLVSVCLACQSLRAGESEIALAGGVNLMLAEAVSRTLAKTQALSDDGKCRTFDAGANGYVRGEGCGILILKRLADAERAGDPILGVIRASVMNQDGRSTGLTAPNVLSQQTLLRRALEHARLSPEDIGYIETHGTGTSLGDPIEFEALRDVLGKPRQDGSQCVLGALKTNIGHLESAAGVAGLIKTVLCLQHEAIPRNLHFKALNPLISLEGTPFLIPTTTIPWKTNGKPRRAGVSSFGFSGTNAHVIVEEAPRREPRAIQEESSYLLPLSAKSSEALLALATAYHEGLSKEDTSLHSITYTASVRRSHLEHRLAVTGQSKDEIGAALTAYARGEMPAGLIAGKTSVATPKIIFVFSGQGSQWVGMGQKLLTEEPAFRDALLVCDEAIRKQCEFSVVEEIQKAEGESRLDETIVAQPALFAVEVALAALLQSWGVTPGAVIGHSVGEIAAAHVAGVLDLDQAARLVALRARVMQKATGHGKMVSVALGEEDAKKAIRGLESRAGIAAINDFGSVVLSGDIDVIDGLVKRLSADAVQLRALRVNYAFHSPQMDPLCAEFLAALGTMDPTPGTIPIISTVAGRRLPGENFDAAYWAQNIRQTVRFADAIAAACTDDNQLFVEVGPHPVLSFSVEQMLVTKNVDGKVIPTLRRQKDEKKSVLQALGALYVYGHGVEWQRLYPEGGQLVSLPTYPWQKERFWIDDQRIVAGSIPSNYYDAYERQAGPQEEFEEKYYTFGPFPQVIPEFSWVQHFLTSERGPFTDLVLDTQRELRQTLFRHVDFSSCRKALDFGCGVSTDIVQLARQHAHLELHGYTISAEQVKTGQQRAQKHGVQDRIHVYHRDSSRDPFPAMYDLVFGFEVAHYIRDKHALFSNVSEHLQPGGLLVLADFISTAGFAIEHEESNSFFLMAEEWADHFAQHGIGVIDCVDTSHEMANFLHEPHFHEKIEEFRRRGTDENIIVAFQSFDGLGKLFRRDLARYVLITARKEADRDAEELRSHNLRLLEAPISYASVRSGQEIDNDVYHVQWSRVQSSFAHEQVIPGNILVFSDEHGTGRAMQERLRNQGQRCVRIVTGTKYQVLESDLVCINPLEPEHYRRVLRDMLGPQGQCDLAVHLASLDAAPYDQTTAESLMDDLVHASVSAAYLAQAIVRHGFRDSPRLFLVTRGAQSVKENDSISVAQAPILGLGKTIALEHPELRCARIDLDPQMNEMVDQDVEALLRELGSADREDQIALRDEVRYAARLVRGRFAPIANAISPVRGDCSYLITGGLGGLGLSLAEWMVQQGARSMVLVGRKEPTENAQQAIHRMEEAGARVRCVQADVARSDDVQELLTTIRNEMPPLRGIVHAAAVIEDRTLLEQTAQSFQNVFSPKALGAWNLSTYCHEPLDFFVMYSSAASLLGSPGQGNYCAANAFLDALAQERARRGLCAMSIQWGAFAEVGLAAAAAHRGNRLSSRGISSFSPTEGLEALRRLLSNPRPEVSIVRFDPRQWVEFYPTAAGLPYFSAVLKEKTSGRKRGKSGQDMHERLRAAAPETRPEIVLRHVLEQVGAVLQLEPSRIDPKAPFQSLGMDSLLSLELRNRLESSLGCKLSATLLFTYPYAATLAKHVLDSLRIDNVADKPVFAAAPTESEKKTEIDAVAVIGMACRFPAGGHDPEAFWQALQNGADGVRRIPVERWPADAIPGDKPETFWAALLDSVDTFDASFFGISPREATQLDPQQRLLLELSWEALERSGQAIDGLMGSRTGVFLGMSSFDYQQLLLDTWDKSDAYSLLGGMGSTAAGRLSYTFGFQGPCATIDTACSSSMTAIHLACQSLRNGESDMVLAGGVHMVLSAKNMVLMSETQAMSVDGRCKSFDAEANGFVIGEGGGIVILKRMVDAERDGDPILAIIRGSATNQDGRSTGLTAPNVLSQQALLRRALEVARLSPEDIGYIEAHGTGTPLGDPIEIDALRAVIGKPRQDGSTCVLGALKTNIGHLSAAAGVAGLIKAILCLQHEAIPKNLHFKTLNPRLSLEGTPFVIPTETIPWKTNGKPRRAGVSSFGISGTNVHVILEEAPRREDRAFPEPSSYVLPLSAKTREALVATAKSYQEWLLRHDEPLHHVTYMASSRRSHLEHRVSVAGSTREEISAALGAFVAGETPSNVIAGKAAQTPPKVVFVFPGQGSQWAGMGQQLYREEPIFARALGACDEAIRKEAGFSIIEELQKSEEDSRLGETIVAQPALFAIEVALAGLLQSWGVNPSSLIGHSVGEISAAYVAGILDLEQAARLVTLRARVMQQATGQGKMVSVSLDEQGAKKIINGLDTRIGIAAVNDPGSVVLSGDVEAIDGLVSRLSANGVQSNPLRVNYAFHSPQMETLRAEFVKALGSVAPKSNTIPIISTVTGKRLDAEDFNADYWGQNLRQTVRFADAVVSASAEGNHLFVEVGPHPVLHFSLEQILAARDTGGKAIPTLRRQKDEKKNVLQTLGALYVHGYAVEWNRLYPEGGQVVALPAYPWQRQRFWLESPKHPRQALASRSQSGSQHPLLGPSTNVSTLARFHLWEQSISVASHPYLDDHQVHGEVVFPGAGYVEMALAAGSELFRGAGFVLESVAIEGMLTLPRGSTHGQTNERIVQVVATEEETGRISVHVASRANREAPWQKHASAIIKANNSIVSSPRYPEAPSEIQKRIGEAVPSAIHYREMANRGFSYGASFQGVRQFWPSAREVLGQVELPQELVGDANAHNIHPALLDACLQVGAVLLSSHGSDGTYVPVGIDKLQLYARPGHALWVHGLVRDHQDEGNHELVFDIWLLDEKGNVVIQVDGLRARRFAAENAAQDHALDRSMFVVSWERTANLLDFKVSKSKGAWLILEDRSGTGAALMAQLRARGERCVHVQAAERYRRVAPDHYEIDVVNPDDYQNLLRDAFGEQAACRGVVHLFSLDDVQFEQTTSKSLESDLERGCVSATYLAAALVRQGWRDAPRLWLVTRGAQAVGPVGSAIAVSAAQLWGLGAAIAHEHQELRCTRVDLDPEMPPNFLDAFVNEVGADELEEQIAFRAGRRYVARFVRREKPKHESGPEKPPEIRPHATYLISGGLGGIGLTIAQWLVDRGARHLVLMGRSKPSTTAREALSAMESNGVQVMIAHADVSSEEALRGVFEDLDRAMPPLAGIFHCAAVLDDATLLRQNHERFRRVFAPKVKGAWNLHAQTRGQKLDYFVLFSSAASLLGAPGQANYSAANAFLDALAHHRRTMGLAALSVNWGVWADVGIAAAAANRGERLGSRGFAGMAPADAIRAFDDVLQSSVVQMAIMPFDLRQWSQFYPRVAASPFFAELRKDSSAHEKERRGEVREAITRAAVGQRQILVAKYIGEQTAKVLQIPASQVEPHAPLRTLGFDSLMAVELRNRLETGLDLKLSATLVWGYPTIAELAAELLRQMDLPIVDEPIAAQASEFVTASNTTEDEVETLSRDELVAALARELEDIEREKLS